MPINEFSRMNDQMKITDQHVFNDSMPCLKEKLLSRARDELKKVVVQDH